MAGLSVRRLRARRRRIAGQIPDLETVIAGSLQNQRRRSADGRASTSRTRITEGWVSPEAKSSCTKS